ncbi:methyltransferase [Streptomyces griseosporeus]|uniref:methyltransferase n=1 Tax=Streptomyces griseosporeus TaxID=1910 RepID=UPI0036FAA61B
MPLDLHEATSRRRASMVDRLTTDGVLTDKLLRDALLRLPREVLLPHAYVRVSGPGADPIDWRLLDGSHPDDQEEWLDLIHSDESILLQRDSEPLDALPRGPVTRGHMTSMSTYTPATVEALQAMQLGPRTRYLELGPGPGVSLALAATITGPGLATGVERDGHMTAFAQRNLDRLGVGADVVEGDALEGHEVRAPYDRIHSGIGVPCAPEPWVEQLAPGGRLLTTLVTRSPSWPGQLHDDSWAVAGPGDGTVRVCGPRDVWAELEELHARWEEADRPDSYTVDLTAGTGAQTVTSGAGSKALTWTLQTLAGIPLPRS